MSRSVIPALLTLSLLLPDPGLPGRCGAGEIPGEDRAGPSVPGESEQDALEEAALVFARAWVDGDSRGLESLFEPDGIRLHLQGELYPTVDPNRAVGAIRAFLDKYAGGEAELMRTSRSSGGEPRGFADFQWRTQVAGSGEVVIFTLFVAFSMDDGAWTVTEIRVLP